MKNFVQSGHNVTVGALSAVQSGQGYKIGSLFGIATGDADAGADVVLCTMGVFDIDKIGADTFAVGDPVYWSEGDDLVTSDDTTNVEIGVAIAAAGDTAATARVRLHGSL
jgi:predicted RecA/RadA family phage recombinase